MSDITRNTKNLGNGSMPKGARFQAIGAAPGVFPKTSWVQTYCFDLYYELGQLTPGSSTRTIPSRECTDGQRKKEQSSGHRAYILPPVRCGARYLALSAVSGSNTKLVKKNRSLDGRRNAKPIKRADLLQPLAGNGGRGAKKKLRSAVMAANNPNWEQIWRHYLGAQ